MDSKPGWDDVEQQAKDIAIDYFETKGNSNDRHQNKDHDERKMNQLIFN